MAAITEQRAQAVLHEYAHALAGAPLSAHTRRAYRSRVAGFLRWLAIGALALPGDPLGDPRARDRAVAAYRSWLTTVRGARPTTVNAALTALDHFYRHLRLGPAATDREELPASVRRALPADQVQALLATVDAHGSPRDRAITYTLLFTGVRVAELVGLDMSDLHLAARSSHLLVRDRDGAGSRRVPIEPPPRPALRAWLGERLRWAGAGATEALFVNRRGGRLSTRSVDALVSELGEEAGLSGQTGPLTPRVLRHTCGARLLRAGEDPAAVAHRLGHRRSDTVRGYAGAG